VQVDNQEVGPVPAKQGKAFGGARGLPDLVSPARDEAGQGPRILGGRLNDHDAQGHARWGCVG
jgi:hypothetical protein